MTRYSSVAALLTLSVGLAFQALAQAPAAGQAAPGQGRGNGPTGTETGFRTFQTKCMNCHGNPEVERAPSPAVIRQMSPERIYAALTTGPMAGQGQSLSDTEKKMLALFMSGRPLGSEAEGDAKNMAGHCDSNPPLPDPASGPEWNGWGVDAYNTRYQTAKGAGLTAAQVPNLKLKWAFGFPTGLSAFGQPTIASGRVFVGTDIGYVYSLNAKTGCVYWSFQTKGSVRNAISIGQVKGQAGAKYAIYFGDSHSNVYAVNAQNGALLWMTPADEHFTARITGAPALYEGRVYAPVSSSEELSGSNLDYSCCTFRGSVVAMDANTGKMIWKTYTIPETPKPTRKNSKGVQQYAPAGASVWNTPTIDVKRHAIYFGTGDSETTPAATTSDAVMALDIDTGKVLWSYQAQANDSWLGGCNGNGKTDNCPDDQGPDWDIGNSPILRTLPNGKRILVAGTKNGDVFALDPDKNGEKLWRINIANKERSGIVWGGAADERNGYYGLSGGGIAAVQLSTGEKLWFNPLTNDPNARFSNAAAATAIPGVAFVGGSDAKLRAVASSDGHLLWETDMNKQFDTVNKVSAKGGAMGAPGATVAGGMLYVGSGYGVLGQIIPGNVLLAFSPE
jgi:polyvinyl alcohol dehydrogenase (cytochrome)